MMHKLITLFCALGVFTQAVAARTIPLESLGSLSLAYSESVAVDKYAGKAIAAEVTFRNGSAFTLVAPRRIQQIHYLVEVGQSVEKGQAFAELRGPEMHHFLTELEVSRQLLASAERRYQRNKPLYEKKAIKESQWVEVSEKYYTARLEYEHMRHFHDLITRVDAEADLIVIGAPISGVVDYDVNHLGVREGDHIAVFVPPRAIRLKADLPASARERLVALKTSHCELAVAAVTGVASNFFVSAWSEPLKPECGLILGQTLLVSPEYATRGFRLPRSAVFQHSGGSQVLVKKGGKLQLVPVELIASAGEAYIVTSNYDLDGAEVLTSSISAVQGILLGLGGE